MVSATLGIANAIITESALSFLGLGFPPDFPTWGRLLYDGATFIQITPSRVIWPGVFIALTVLSVNISEMVSEMPWIQDSGVDNEMNLEAS